MIFTVVAANRPVRRAPEARASSSIWSSPRSRSHQSDADDPGGEVAVAGGAEVGGVVVHPEVGGHDRVLPGRDPEGVQVSLALEQSLVHLVGRRFGCETADEVCGALVQRAARLAARVALDPAVGRIGRLRCDPGQLQRPAVHPRAMAVAVRQEHDAVGHDRIEEVLGRDRHPGTRPSTSRRPGSIRGPDAPPHTSSRAAGSPRWSGGRGGRTATGRHRRPPGGRARPGTRGASIRPSRSKTSVRGPTCSRIGVVAPHGDDPSVPHGDRLLPGSGRRPPCRRRR